MIVTAELPLIASALAFAIAAIILALPRRRVRWRAPGALIAGAIAALTPLLTYPLREETLVPRRALWEWSTIGGPTIQAAYRFDGLAAIGIAAALAYTTAGLLAAQRASRRHQLLPGIVLANGLVTIALAVTVDLVAATVVLGVIAALTGFAQLIVAPAAASARLAAFYAAGVQSFVVGTLLISRAGTASFAFGDIRATAISPGAVLAVSVGAALFAGLYPFIPWRYEGESARTPEREPLRGVLAMPAGVAATIVLARLLGATEIELSTLGLPGIHSFIRIAAAAVVVGAAILFAARARPVRVAPLAVAAGLVLLLALYPELHWSYVVLAAVLLTIGYAAAVALALPEQWEVVRYDVTLAGVWIGLAVGTPLAIAGGLLLLLADAAAAMLGAVWLPPHRWYISTISSATAFAAGLLTILLGILGAPDLPTQVLAAIAVVALLLLILLQLGREVSETVVPAELDVAGGAVAFLWTTLLALLAGSAIVGALAVTLGRPLGPIAGNGPLVFAAIAVSATLLAALARTTRPFLPDLASIAVRLRALVLLFDPVPALLATFGLLERIAVRSSGLFAAFERRAGVWLAAALIVGLLVWATGA